MKQVHQNKAVLLLGQTKLFESADIGALSRGIEAGGGVKVFSRGENIFADERFKPAIGLLLSGKAKVKKGRAAISSLEKGSLFGAVTLYGDMHDSATQITAVSACKVLFIPQTLMSSLMAENSKIAESYIAYLSQRIYFLTDKIEAFTAGSAERRLANQLLNNSETDKNGKRYTTVDNLSLLARELDIGRASLYRALDFFESEGAIIREGKNIMIADETKLEIKE